MKNKDCFLILLLRLTRRNKALNNILLPLSLQENKLGYGERAEKREGKRF